MLQALGELGWLHSRALSAGVHPQPVSMSFLPASSPRCFCAEFFPSSAGVSMCGLLTASSGRSSPQILWGFFWMFLSSLIVVACSDSRACCGQPDLSSSGHYR